MPPAPLNPPRPLKLFLAETVPGSGVKMDLTFPTEPEPDESANVIPGTDGPSTSSGVPLEVKEEDKKETTSGESTERNLPDVVSESKQEVLPEVIFNCHRCFESFKDKDALARHLQHHPQVTRIMCLYCNLSFQKPSYLTTHLHRCYRRKKSLSSKGQSSEPRDLYDRIKLKNGNGEQESGCTENLCQICIKTYPTRRALKTHIRLAHLTSKDQKELSKPEVKSPAKCESQSKKSYSCPVCCKIYKKVHHLTYHLSSKHKKRLGDFPILKLPATVQEANATSCPICHKDFHRKDNLVRHLKNIHGMNMQDFLKEESQTKQDTKEKQKATQDKCWLCPVCYRIFSGKYHILRHVQNDHKRQYREIEAKLRMVPKERAIRLVHFCRTCRKGFRSPANYEEHASKARGKNCEKRFQCNTCVKLFVRKVDCADHIQEHFGKYQCRKARCRKVFNNDRSRETHEQSHIDSVEKEPPKKRGRKSSEGEPQEGPPKKKAKISANFKCKTCRKKFDREYLLAKHKLEHNNQDPWHCYICFKIFYLDRSIVKHMEMFHEGVIYCQKCYCVLAGERSGNRLCVDCDKRGRSNSLKCGLCKTEFDTAPSLAQHILTHNNEDNPAAPETKPESSTERSQKAKPSTELSVPKRLPGRPPGRKSPVIASSKVSTEKIQCSVCKTRCEDVCLLAEHTMRHEDDRVRRNVQYRCSLCDKLCKNVTALSLHILEHDSDKTSPTHERLRATLNSGSELRRITRSCPQGLSGESSPQKTPQSVQKTTRSVQKDQVASTSAATAKKTLSPVKSSHGKSSSKGYVNVCMKCGERGIASDDLTKHARTHLSSESEFRCNGCHKPFPNLDDIEVHLATAHPKVHSYTVAKSAYQCLFCGMDFHNIMEARKHVLSTNVSCMLECPECGQEYGRQGDLMVHMINVHKQYLECDKCLAQFTRPIDLQNHLKQHSC